MEAKEQIRAKALETGFDTAGFAAAGPVKGETAQRFREWLAAGHHSGMYYLEHQIEARLDPRLVLPEARTVIVVLCNHFRENPTQSLSSGKIACYAGGRDYHKVVGKALKSLSSWIRKSFPGTKTWYEVDTGPVLERYWAQQAGLGWMGKNTLLINTHMGSWTFLGVILTSLELPPDPPHPDHCGTCTRCLDTCPTQAFPAPGVLDSNRCISYWTIEHRGEFPAGIGKSLNGWIFGCDDCQTVCPWNRHAKETSHPEFQLASALQTPNPDAWSAMSWEKWDEMTRGTALRRAGFEGLTRNCKAVLAKPVP
jgi:epoxyqueuosine reductase